MIAFDAAAFGSRGYEFNGAVGGGRLRLDLSGSDSFEPFRDFQSKIYVLELEKSKHIVLVGCPTTESHRGSCDNFFVSDRRLTTEQGGDGTPLFYRRYPAWSLLGKIVHDGLAAIDLAQQATGGGAHPGTSLFLY